MRLPHALTPTLDPAVRAALPELEARHVAYLEARLVSEEARAEWRANVSAAFAHLLATPVARLVSLEAVERALDATLDPTTFARTVRPIADAVALLESARLREDERPLGVYVPEAVRAQIDALLEQPGLVPERALREVLEHEATGAVMRDVLYDALTEFSEKVNPFFAEWGLPSILKRLGPFGLGGMLKGFESMRAEFDRRLEPEIRTFLAGFSRRALKNLADFTIAKADEPEFIALRKHLVDWVLERPIASLVPEHGDDRAERARAIAQALTEHYLGREDTGRQRRAALELAVHAHAAQPLADALAVYGVTLAPDLDAIADATWPVVREVLASEPIRAWLATITREFYASL